LNNLITLIKIIIFLVFPLILVGKPGRTVFSKKSLIDKILKNQFIKSETTNFLSSDEFEDNYFRRSPCPYQWKDILLKRVEVLTFNPWISPHQHGWPVCFFKKNEILKNQHQFPICLTIKVIYFNSWLKIYHEFSFQLSWSLAMMQGKKCNLSKSIQLSIVVSKEPFLSTNISNLFALDPNDSIILEFWFGNETMEISFPPGGPNELTRSKFTEFSRKPESISEPTKRSEVSIEVRSEWGTKHLGYNHLVRVHWLFHATEAMVSQNHAQDHSRGVLVTVFLPLNPLVQFRRSDIDSDKFLLVIGASEHRNSSIRPPASYKSNDPTEVQLRDFSSKSESTSKSTKHSQVSIKVRSEWGTKDLSYGYLVREYWLIYPTGAIAWQNNVLADFKGVLPTVFTPLNVFIQVRWYGIVLDHSCLWLVSTKRCQSSKQPPATDNSTDATEVQPRKCLRKSASIFKAVRHSEGLFEVRSKWTTTCLGNENQVREYWRFSPAEDRIRQALFKGQIIGKFSTDHQHTHCLFCLEENQTRVVDHLCVMYPLDPHRLPTRPPTQLRTLSIALLDPGPRSFSRRLKTMRQLESPIQLYRKRRRTLHFHRGRQSHYTRHRESHTSRPIPRPSPSRSTSPSDDAYAITNLTQLESSSARQTSTVESLKYTIPLHDYKTRNIDTTVSLEIRFTTTRQHTQNHTLVPPTRGNQRQQVIEIVTEALAIDALNHFTSTILLHGYITRQHDTPVSALIAKGYVDIDYPKQQRNTRPYLSILKHYRDYTISPCWNNSYSITPTTIKADRISLHSYYTRLSENSIPVHGLHLHATNPPNNKNSYFMYTLKPNTNTKDIEPERDPHIL
jgi:hypothetical protein